MNSLCQGWPGGGEHLERVVLAGPLLERAGDEFGPVVGP